MGYIDAAKNLYKFVVTGNPKYSEAVVGSFRNQSQEARKLLDDKEDSETVLEGGKE